MNRNAYTIEPVMALLSSIIAASVVVVQSRFDPDIVAVIGALIAGVITFLEAQEKGRSRTLKITMFVSSVAVGSFFPGGFMWWKFPDSAPTLSWQAWASLGFGFGLLGWAFVAAILGMRGNVPGFIGNLISLFTKKP